MRAGDCLGQAVRHPLEGAELGVTVRVPGSPVEQDDAEAARQVTGQMESPAARKVYNERGERVAGVQQCRAGHTQLAPAPAAGLTSRRRALQVWVLGTMAAVNPVVDETPGAANSVDPESAEWLGALAGRGARQEAALARLHEMLLRIAQRECRRRGPRLRITGPELEDLAYQAAADALVAIIRKLGQFRGESRFTTWAYKFFILEVSDKIGRHFWQTPGVRLDAEDWDKLPDRFGFEPAREAEWRDLLAAPRRGHRAVSAAASGIHRDRGQRRSPGCPGYRAQLQPQRDLQDDVRRPA